MANSINPTSIPSITNLREQLDYGDPHLPRCQAFYDSVRVFRKTFVTNQGWEGSTIHEWRSREHRSALSEMARAYLERHGNGQLFWPDDDAQGRANKLKYSTDCIRIKRIMQQLFWRLNLQQHRNAKYKKNKEKAGSVDIMSGRGLSHEDPIDLDVAEDRLESPILTGMPDSSRSTTVPEPTLHPEDVDASVIDPALGDPQQDLRNGREVSRDPYLVPKSPDLHVQDTSNQNQNQNQNIFASTSSAIPNDERQFAPYADMGPPTKRPRLDNAKSSRTTSMKRAGKTPIGLRTTRISPRKRKLRQQQGFPPPEELTVIFQSLEDHSSPEIVDGPTASESHSAAADVSSTSLQRAPNPFRATVEDVTDEDGSVNAFVDEALIQLNTETEMPPPQSKDSPNSTRPSAPVQPTEATPGDSLPTVAAAGQTDRVSSPVAIKSAETIVEKAVMINHAPQTTTSRQSQVDFVYRVIIRQPTRRSYIWKPKGSFRSKTLAELVQELPGLPLQFEWSELKYLLFRLVARNTEVEETVPCWKEDGFESLKRLLTSFIRACIAETPRGEVVCVYIDIEPLATLDSVEEAADVEELGFEW
ncbi:hypothetical protein CORC01_08681 [Colletotrichum orchidophilum]|uniref:Uncharacterized protein n=1 Tax=Colletotrichum orchidophilum TaxID=1209926 RepID=A0A1G4B3I2_9PEZI|nr:uncharacterized protein CORC01_08681 [Colletotrichum orchidophilum]OHE95988.1 hypothetical protein CORC01_08681 [Colletotrichum orchidophilum]